MITVEMTIREVAALDTIRDVARAIRVGRRVLAMGHVPSHARIAKESVQAAVNEARKAVAELAICQAEHSDPEPVDGTFKPRILDLLASSKDAEEMLRRAIEVFDHRMATGSASVELADGEEGEVIVHA